mgnify:FL=1
MAISRSKNTFLIAEDADEIPCGVEMKPFVALSINEEPATDPATAPPASPSAQPLAPHDALRQTIKQVSWWMRLRNFFHLAG